MTVEAMNATIPHILWFEDLSRADVARVGGKNASLGEMVRNLGKNGVQVPAGFATTADGLLAIHRRQWAARHDRLRA